MAARARFGPADAPVAGLGGRGPGSGGHDPPAHGDDDPLADAQRVRPDVRVRALDHRDAHAIPLGNLRQRLTARDIVIHERDPVRHREAVVALGDDRPATARHAHHDAASRRRDPADELRVQLEDRRDARIREPCDHVQAGRVGNRDLVELEPRQRFHLVEPVALRLLGDQRRGDQLGHVVARLAAQIPAVGELEEGEVAHRVGVAAAPAAAAPPGQATDAALDAAHACVVGGRRQVDAPQPLPQVREVVHSRLGRLEGIAPFVHPRVHREAVQPGCARHELPHPHRLGPAHRRVREPALDQRQVDQILGQPLRPQPVADHALVAPQPGQPDLEAVARVHLEELEVLEHPPVGGEARDVNVEGGLGRGRRADRGFALGAEQPYRLPLDLFSLDGGRRGRVPAGPHAVGARGRAMQAVEHLLVGGRILRDPRDCRAKRVHGARRAAVTDHRRDRAGVRPLRSPARRQHERQQRAPNPP